ncbi:MAG: polysaccharide pyruvyl transferase CsaB [Acidaminococcus sp.]|nr:polysaccharide pyruvyl transferase CsaB [Acidaminococcus sp.]MCI2100178.1 polysaccharide pyruvyl transferase CsaB [Acidaminococcus sp.]MCI2114497.1 polysaccharide pyruvyl transferase CsaB [Acidaminococcus sp.]MCI2116499.1 polysaccharide pyruvyl transferase CsaB [Acidaminococcus sp.]
MTLNKILISGYYGFSNAGDEAMLTAILTSLRKADPDVELTVISGHPHVTERIHQVRAIHRFDFIKILREMKKTDMLLSGGGSLLQNVTSYVSLFYYLSIIGLAALMHRKIMLFAQGIGPIRGAFSRFLTHQICRHADLITVRDDGSLEDLCAMGFAREEVHVTSDAVFSLPPGRKEAGQLELEAIGMNRSRPVIGFALRHWKGEDRFIKEFAAAADALKKAFGCQILFIPLQFPADQELSKAVKHEMQNADDVYILDRKLSTQSYQDLISSLSMLIGMRLHALVFAALNDVPFMAVSYDPKVDRFVSGMKGHVVNTIDRVTAGEIVSLAQTLSHSDGRQEKEQIAALRQEARANIDRAIALLHK